jgi:murein DD-endopeptidase MepM/ murein hydrolase activator NlpD
MMFAAAVAASIASAIAMWGPAPARAAADPNGLGFVPSGSGPVPGSYSWPVVGPVIRGFLSPQDPYGPGHRGIDIAVPLGTPVQSSNDGVVAFAGWVGGSLYVSIDHADGVRTTYSWLSSVAVRKGDVVLRGDVVAATGYGHPEIPQPHLHFGARIGQTYIDPMILLGGGDVVSMIHLAPLDELRR